ncbi:MAG: hypothetical protein AW09_001921 [Candidatus Accumulibacter phosphatis]|uniref:Uncharacterized protein n=1 Tax=Candidatus Accumulibacter phosphatis TaxID=327160 RepID=A0A080LYA1_9PROT|nr:MAG: hypothetical protein AW09_001921 [Candidatus Accumulibacter phosphatis]
MLLGQASALALVIAQCEQEHLRGNELVAAFLRLLVGNVEQVAKITADLYLAAVSLDLRQTSDRLRQCRLQRRHIDTGARQQGRGCAIVLLQQGQQEVLWLDQLVVVADRQTLGIGQRLLEFGRQFVETHVALLRRFMFMRHKWGHAGLSQRQG